MSDAIATRGPLLPQGIRLTCASAASAQLPPPYSVCTTSCCSLTTYLQVPRELTEGSALGGLVSLAGLLLSGYLVYVHIARFCTTSVKTDVQLERSQGELHLRFELTMERLPCRFSSVDLFDETGTKRLNLSASIDKQRVSSKDGRLLSSAVAEAWHDEEPVVEKALPTSLDEAVNQREIVVVLYGVLRSQDERVDWVC